MNTNTVQHRVRNPRPQVEAVLRSQGMHPLLARLMAARGVFNTPFAIKRH